MPEERRRLRVKDPEQYHWHPKRLITQLAQIHISLYRARRGEWVQVRHDDEAWRGTSWGGSRAAGWQLRRGDRLLGWGQ